jgi:TonB family protein
MEIAQVIRATSLIAFVCMSLWMSPLLAQWTTTTSKDQMSGNVEAYAVSQSVNPTKTMRFPYSDVRAWLGVGCDGAHEWAYVGFSSTPVVTDDVTRDGYNQVRTRIKWDDTIESVTFTQPWGASALHFLDDGSVIVKLAASNTVLLELPWYGEGPVYFRFSLNGSTAALSEMRKICEPRRKQLQAEQEQHPADAAKKQKEALEAKQKAQAEDDLRRELAAGNERREAVQPGVLEEYIRAIQNKIEQNWNQPPSAKPGLECVVNVVQLPTGDVYDVKVDSSRCNGDAAVRRSIEAAVRKASPLPKPPSQAVFERNLTVTFSPSP